MRINVYSQELITEGPTKAVERVEQTADTGIVYSAVRLFLISPEQLHHTDEDDDRSAITFWLPKSYNRRLYIANCFKHMAALIESAPTETGLD
jgi:hypothetical protein